MTYTADDIRAMNGPKIHDLLKPMSPGELREALIYISGYAPEAAAAALNFLGRTAEIMAAEGREDAREVTGYRLACGCTKPGPDCTCPGCLAGKAHEVGEVWYCGEHDKTAVAEVLRDAPSAVTP